MNGWRLTIEQAKVVKSFKMTITFSDKVRPQITMFFVVARRALPLRSFPIYSGYRKPVNIIWLGLKGTIKMMIEVYRKRR